MGHENQWCTCRAQVLAWPDHGKLVAWQPRLPQYSENKRSNCVWFQHWKSFPFLMLRVFASFLVVVMHFYTAWSLSFADLSQNSNGRAVLSDDNRNSIYWCAVYSFVVCTFGVIVDAVEFGIVSVHSFFLFFPLIWYWYMRWNGRRYQHVLALCALLTGVILKGLTLWKNVFDACVCMFCFMFAK